MGDSESSPTRGSPLFSNSGLQIPAEAAGPSGAVGTGSRSFRESPSKKLDAVAQDRLARKLLTTRRQLLVKIKSLKKALKFCKTCNNFSELMTKTVGLCESYDKYKKALNDIDDDKWLTELTDGIFDKYEECMKLFSDVESRFATVACDKDSADLKSVSNSEFELSHSSTFTSKNTSTLSDKTITSRQTEIKRKRTELQVNHELMAARIKAREQAQIEEAEALARLKRDEAALEAEEQLLAQSERSSCSASSSGLQFSGLRQYKSQSSDKRSNAKEVPNLRKMSVNDGVTEPKRVFQQTKNLYDFQNDSKLVPSSENAFQEKLANVGARNQQCYSSVARMPNMTAQPAMVMNHEPTIMQTYLERQGRNEYVNLASQIAYNGTNLAFVFYKNQIRRRMDESSYPERRFEVLRASCVGQPREIINLFFAPMKSLSTLQRIEKALDRLRQGYGVPSGLTSEPKIIEIRNGSKVTLNSTSLNLDYLTKIGSDVNRPKFDTLRKFVAGEQRVSTSDYAQTFFKSKEKDKCQKGGKRGGSQQVRVRQIAVNSDNGHPPGGYRQQGSNTARESGVARPEGYPRRRSLRTQPSKPPPLCFACDDEKSLHFLADCDKFKHLTGQQQQQQQQNSNWC